MTYLLDTNVVIWALLSPEKLGIGAVKILQENDVVISSVTLLEYTIKTMLGKMSFKLSNDELCSMLGVDTILPFTAEHASALTRLGDLARHDPFDRMLLSQATTEGFTLLTSDKTLLDLRLAFVQSSLV